MVWPTDLDSKLEEYNYLVLPGQQMAASHAHSQLDHLLNLDIKAPTACQRLTSIIACMGPSTSDIDLLEKMIGAGMNVALLNMSFSTRANIIDTIKMLRTAAKNYSVKMEKNYPLTIAAILSGRKIRTGNISDTYGDSVELKAGEFLRLTTDETYKDRCSTYTVYVDYMYFAEEVTKNDIILLDNEKIMLIVDIISSTTITCKIERGGTLGSNKDVFLPNVVFNMPNYSEKDKKDIELLIRHQIDFLFTPFCSNRTSITELKEILGVKGKKIGIVAIIQSIEGYNNFESIIEVANGVMISRQELGSDISPNKLIIAQKNMIVRANKVNIPVCVAAHLLSSMRHNKIPLRSDLLDVANCILDGADALVLGAETAIGDHPLETVASLAAACKEAESCVWSKQIFLDMIDKTPSPCNQVNGAAISAVLAAQRSLAAVIVVVTTSGVSAQIVSKYKPRCPIMAVTRYPQIAKQLHLWRGIIPIIYEDTPDVDWQVDIEKRINFCTKWAVLRGFARVGDPVVIVSGWRQGSGSTNTMRLVYISPDTTVD